MATAAGWITMTRESIMHWELPLGLVTSFRTTEFPAAADGKEKGNERSTNSFDDVSQVESPKKSK